MGRKSNPIWREENAERLAKQKRCVWCRKLNNPRYLVYTERGYAHRLCAKAAKMEPEEILEWKRKADDYEVRDAPPEWAVIRARRLAAEREQRKRHRQSHLALRNYWVDGPPSPEAETGTPGSGAYNAKYGFER
jgi:pyruvate-formate lyase-activating enzyme